MQRRDKEVNSSCDEALKPNGDEPHIWQLDCFQTAANMCAVGKKYFLTAGLTHAMITSSK